VAFVRPDDPAMCEALYALTANGYEAEDLVSRPWLPEHMGPTVAAGFVQGSCGPGGRNVLPLGTKVVFQIFQDLSAALEPYDVSDDEEEGQQLDYNYEPDIEAERAALEAFRFEQKELIHSDAAAAASQEGSIWAPAQESPAVTPRTADAMNAFAEFIDNEAEDIYDEEVYYGDDNEEEEESVPGSGVPLGEGEMSADAALLMNATIGRQISKPIAQPHGRQQQQEEARQQQLDAQILTAQAELRHYDALQAQQLAEEEDADEEGVCDPEAQQLLEMTGICSVADTPWRYVIRIPPSVCEFLK